MKTLPGLPHSRDKEHPDRPWLECAGELAHLHRETMRIQKTVDEEFEQIEPEDFHPPGPERRRDCGCAGSV
jgi:hypothetical protein